MLSFIGRVDTDEDINILTELLSALHKSCRKDPYLETRLRFSNHPHGWGYLLIVKSDDRLNITYKKSLKPIYEDDDFQELIEKVKKLKGEKVLILIHGRRTREELSKSILGVHPLHVYSIHGYELWLCHNGSVSEEKLQKLLDLPDDVFKKLRTKYPDSYLLTLYLARYSLNEVEMLLKELKDNHEFVKTALNLEIVTMNKNKIQLINVVSFKAKNENDKKYYMMYRISSNKSIIYCSSTIIDYYVDKEELENVSFKVESIEDVVEVNELT